MSRTNNKQLFTKQKTNKMSTQKFEFKANPVTGLQQAQFQAKLISAPSEKTLQNSNGKSYKICTIEFENSKGVTVRRSASIYEGNYSKGVSAGKSYLTTATISGQNVYLQMSHLENATRAELEDFEMVSSQVSATELARG